MQDLDRYVLVGDSFGAAVALTLAVRRPPQLRGLVLSGGFASDPLKGVLPKIGSYMAPLMPGLLYRQLTLRTHALLLRSPHDTGPGAEIRWPLRASRQLFVRSTSLPSYVGRVRAVQACDLRDRLPNVEVPTLVLSPSYDHLVGEDATKELCRGIARAEHVVLPDTGHMFRFSHPGLYAAAVTGFLERAGVTSLKAEAR